MDQVWNHLEVLANLERQKSQESKAFCTKVKAATNNGCAVCLSMVKDKLAATQSAVDQRWQPSDDKIIPRKAADPRSHPTWRKFFYHSFVGNSCFVPNINPFLHSGHVFGFL